MQLQAQAQPVWGTKTSQAAAAAKLEKFAHMAAHTTGHTPKKVQGVQQPNPQRRSQGQVPATETSATTVNSQETRKKAQNEKMKTTTKTAKEDEPPMKEILQLKGIKEDMSMLRCKGDWRADFCIRGETKSGGR